MTQYCYTDISLGKLKGRISTNYTGSIVDFLQDFNVDEKYHEPFAGKNFPDVEIYRNVPYAEQPVNDLMYKRCNINNEPIDGEMDCTELGPTLPQAAHMFTLLKDSAFNVNNLTEAAPIAYDALTLDVYKPACENAEALPVMVWIHGGGFFGGSKIDYDGEFIAASRNTIVVIIQYRLGLFGLFRDNLGLWDQRTALEWVQREISAFGGDADNVHILGESAGGASVCHQLNCDAKKSNGPEKLKRLFKKATLMSGASAMSNAIWKPWHAAIANHKIHQYLKENHADVYTAEDADPEAIVDCFKTFTAPKLIELQDILMGYLFTEDPTMMDCYPVVSPAMCTLDNEMVIEDVSDIDFSGYEVNYGMINGDGFLFVMLFGQVSDGPTIKRDAERQLVGKLYVDIIESAEDPVKKALELIKNGMTYDSMKETVKSHFGSNLDGMIETAGQLTEFAYAPYNNGATQSLDPAKMSFLLNMSDRTFTLPMLRHMITCRKNGGKVKGYHIEHGLVAGSKFNPLFSDPTSGACLADTYWENGVNMHGDDLLFLFGYFFMDHGKKFGPRGVGDYNFSMSLCNFIFDNDDWCEASDDDLAIDVTVFDEDAAGFTRKNFRRIQLQLIDSVLPATIEALGKKRTMKVKL